VLETQERAFWACAGATGSVKSEATRNANAVIGLYMVTSKNCVDS
jgi:hypothetical protein